MKGILDRILTGPLNDFLKTLIGFLPNLLSALIILILGFIGGWILRVMSMKIFRILSADNFFRKIGISHAFERAGVKDAPSVVISRIFYWLVVVIFGIMSLYTLNVPAIEVLLQKFLLYLPNFFIALLILVIGLLLGNFVETAVLIASVNAGIRFSKLLSRFVKLVIIIFALTMALEQLGIGHDTVIIAFALVFGGIIFAVSLAFGLGAKDIARDYLEKKLMGSEEEQKGDDIQHL